MTPQRAAAASPLDAAYLSRLLAPARRQPIFSLRPPWVSLANALADLFTRARDDHWASVANADGYPLWARLATWKIVRRAASMIRHIRDEPDLDVLRHVAIIGSGARHQLLPSQVLATFAMWEASQAILVLVKAIEAAAQDHDVGVWAPSMSPVARRLPEWKREILPQFEAVLDRASREYVEPELEYIARHRTRAEKYLMHADQAAQGALSGREAVRQRRELAEAIHAKSTVEAEIAASRAKRADSNKARGDAVRAYWAEQPGDMWVRVMKALIRREKSGDDIFGRNIAKHVADEVSCEPEYVRTVRRGKNGKGGWSESKARFSALKRKGII